MIKGWAVIGTNDQNGNQLNRDEYISYCHNRNKVLIMTEDSGAYWVKGVFSLLQNHTDGILCDIDFPDPTNNDPKKRTFFGSCILAIKMPYDQGYEAISIRDENNTFALYEEDMIRFLQTSNTDNSSAGIDIRGSKGIIDLFVNGGTEIGGKINLSLKNKTNTGQLTVKSDLVNILLSNLNITSSDVLEWVVKDLSKDNKVTSFKYQKGIGLTFLDEFGNSINQNSDYLNIIHKTKTSVTAPEIILTNDNGDIVSQTSDSLDLKHKTKVNIGEGAAHNATFGDELKTLLSTFFDNLNSTYAACLVTCSSPGSPSSPPANVAQMQAITTQAKTALDSILSQYCFIK